MRDESFFFLKVGDVSRRGVVTCGPDDLLQAVAATMRARNISGIVVARDGRPVGMITDRDFRNKLVSICRDMGTMTASSLMTSPVVTIAEADYVFEAIYKMSKHNVHRLVLVDAEGSLAGILTDTDVINLQTTTPLYLNNEIEAAENLEDLRRVNERIVEVVHFANRAGARTRDMVRLISHFNDTVTHRAIALLEREGLALPAGSALLALGSEGRREQTLRTDQDSAAVYRDDLSEEGQRQLGELSTRLVEALVHIGVPPCPGNTMASNPEWRKSVSEWQAALEQWVAVPTPERMVSFGMFQDLRTLCGEPALERRLKDHLVALVQRHSLFLPQVARNILRYPPPLGLFRRLRVERSGEHKGTLDIKKAGIFAITEGIALLALEAGITDGGTWEKAEALAARNVMSLDTLSRLGQAFNYLVHLRLKRQLEAVSRGEKPSNHIAPNTLNPLELDRLKDALEAVKGFLRELNERYKLDFIAR